MFKLDENIQIESHWDALQLVHSDNRYFVEQQFKNALYNKKTSLSLEHQLNTPYSDVLTVYQEIEIYYDANSSEFDIFGIIQDVTARKQSEKKILQLAYYDPLTGLPNNTYLKEYLAYVVDYAKRYKRQLAVISIDLDFFERINDSLGHTYGDQLLKGVSARFNKLFRNSDWLSRAVSPQDSSINCDGRCDRVIRLDGDEFIILLTNIKRAEDVSIVVRRIIESFNEPFYLDDKEVRITASMGISLFPENGHDASALIKNAEVAMHYVKAHGKEDYHFFTESINATVRERLVLEHDLHKALISNTFEMYYQPKLCLQSNRIHAMEALIRWPHPEQGPISPARFIPLAEETNFIIELSIWILYTVCRQNKRWIDEGYEPMRVSVNLSARHFKSIDLVESIAQVLKDTQLPASYLELEITEGALMDDVELSTKILMSLRELGIKIALDDFGTGYSSLSYLKRFPIDVLKIDRSFIMDMHEDPQNEAIVNAIIHLSHSLNLEVVAEGVEKQQELEHLSNLGCNEVQGFYISRPAPAEEFIQFIENWRKQ